MEVNHNHIVYTAAEMQRYLDGNMSPLEMNAFEKAMLDDPFLAEAFEGYEASRESNWKTSLEGLRESFAAPGKGAKVVPMKQVRNNWWKYAAAVLVLGGGISTYFLLNKQHGNNPSDAADIASIKQQVRSATAPAPDSVSKELAINTENNSIPKKQALVKPIISQDNIKTLPPAELTTVTTNNRQQASEEITVRERAKPTPQDIPVKKSVASTKQEENNKLDEFKTTVSESVVNGRSNDKDVIANAEKRSVNPAVKAPVPQNNNGYYNPGSPGSGNDALNKKKAEQPSRTFLAQVLGPDNNPLPFANINITNQGFGTYADVKGNVRLFSTDSIIPVEVKSLGYQTQLVALQSNSSLNKIVLKPEAISASEPVIVGFASPKTNKYRKYAPQQDSTADAEPADGWDNYNTYVANNLELPEEVLNKNLHGEVQVSFEVKSNGAITNIKVDKSLCDDCDEIAKRLVEQGPQWKVKKGKKARARVKVQF